MYKKFWLVVSLLLSLFAHSGAFAATFKQAQKIYEKIVVANHIVDAPPFSVYNTTEINAFTSEIGKGHIWVTQGLLDKGTNNDDELALVIGHELGHWINKGHEVPYYMEYVADDWGFVLSYKAGYNPCNGALWFERVAPRGGTTHPPGKFRTANLEIYCEKA